MPNIFIAAAGTGGHLFSAEKIAHDLEKKGCKITFVGKGLKKNPFFQENKFSYVEIHAGPIVKNFRLIKSFAQISFGFIQSIRILLFKKVDCVVGFGSYHTFPFLLAAKVLGKKTILFEANCLVGQVNKVISSNTIALACQLPLAKAPKGKKIIEVLPFPFKKPIITEGEVNKIPSLLIFGGSQGAKVFNDTMPLVLRHLKQKGFLFKVFHIAGNAKAKKEVENAYEKEKIEAEVFSFCKKMDLLYQKTDLVLSRAGALTISELIYYQKPAVLIPYPFAKDNHQKINAEFFEKIGGGKFLLQKDLAIEKISTKIIELLQKKKYKELVKSLSQYHQKEKQELSRLIMDLCKKSTKT